MNDLQKKNRSPSTNDVQKKEEEGAGKVHFCEWTSISLPLLLAPTRGIWLCMICVMCFMIGMMNAMMHDLILSASSPEEHVRFRK